MTKLPFIKRPSPAAIALTGFAIGILLLGLYMSWGGKTKWMIIGTAVHALPLIGLVLPWARLRAALLWFGLFVLLQDAYSLYTARESLYKTLPPRMHDRFVVSGDYLRGIAGLQQVTTDDKGFRTTAPIDYDYDSNMRIFAVGASTTEQIYLDDRKTWTHLLQQKLGGGAEVINTGVSGLRAEHHLATLKRILPYRPDIVIFLIGVNDWNRHIREHFGSRHYRQNRFKDSLTVAAIRNFLERRRQARKKSAATQDAASEPRREDGDYYADKMGALETRQRREIWLPDTVDTGYESTMRAIAATCRAAQLKCLFLTQPHGYRQEAPAEYRAHFWMTPPGEKFTLDLGSLAHIAGLYNRWLTEFACEGGVYHFDLAAQIPAGFDSFYDEVHFNESGAARVAAALAPALRSVITASAPPSCR